MSETPKKMEFMTMKLSAAELVKASKVAFMVSEPSYWEGNNELENDEN